MGENTAFGEVFFNVNAKLDEQKKTSTQATLSFSLTIETKPNIARYTATGTVKLEGSTQDIEKRLETNPKTQFPQILFTVYQHVFSSIYLLSSVLDTPYPPPDLLHPMQEKIQILSKNAESEDSQTSQDELLKHPETTKTPETRENSKTKEQTPEQPKTPLDRR
jgi:hypothetical protein